MCVIIQCGVSSVHSQVREGIIFSHFAQYGPIDKIRIVDEVNLQIHPNEEHRERYALVTFATARSSYNARVRKSHPIAGRNYWIHVADSCYQERREETIKIVDVDAVTEENDVVRVPETPIPKLNDDCMLKIMTYLDIQTLANMSDASPHLSQLIHQQSRRRATFDFLQVNQLSFENCMQQFGTSLTHLTLDFGQPISQKSPRKIAIRQNQRTVTTIFWKIHMYMDPQLMTYLCVDAVVITPPIFLAIKPLFTSLHVLKLKLLHCAQAEEEVELPSLCPNLTNLKLFGTILLDKSSAVNWPSLKKLSIIHNYNLRASTLVNFLKNNTQLQSLRIHCGLYDNISVNTLVKDILKYQTAPGLEKLVYEDVWNGRQSKEFYLSKQLGQLKTLRKLNLCFRFDYINDDNIQTLTQLQDLTHLTLRYKCRLRSKTLVRTIRSHHLVALAIGLPNLEYFQLSGFQPSEKAIVEFVRYATNLCILNIRGCMRPLNYDFHQNIIKANSNVIIL